MKYIFFLISTIFILNQVKAQQQARISIQKNDAPTSESYQSFTFNGAWCWFSDPRAVYYEGTHKRTYAGWVDNYGDIHIGYYDHETLQIHSKVIAEKVEANDHVNPAILFDENGYLLVFYNKHLQGDTPLFMTRSLKPESIEEWTEIEELYLNDGDLSQRGTMRHTYNNPVKLSAENGRIYNFWRGDDGKPTWSYSDDNGHTWATGELFFITDPIYTFRRPYAKIYSDGIDKIHITLTDGHPRNEENNNIYYMYYQAGAFYKADGTKIRSVDNLPVLPEEADLVYDAAKGNAKAWNWDIAQDEKGNPVIAYVRFPDDENHVYCYAKWDGKRWLNYDLVNSGNWFPETPEGKTEPEPNYSGGMNIDKENPNVLYLSVKRDSVFEIEKWTTRNNGRNWRVEPITRGSVKNNVRPFAVRGAKEGNPLQLLWMQNTRYIHFADARRLAELARPFHDRFHTSIKMDIQSAKITDGLNRTDTVNIMHRIADWHFANSKRMQSTERKSYPRLLVFDSQKSEILRKIENNEWASQIYNDMLSRVNTYVERHQSDPEWILSRYQMNWKPGAHYTTHISDPEGTELIERSGNAPFPTVRVNTHKRPPVAPDGYGYRLPSLEEIKPYDTDSLWLMQTRGPSGEWSLAEPRLFTGSINKIINELAAESAILYWLTDEEQYARFSSDILFQWARGSYYQDSVEGAGRNGLFCVQSLGDLEYNDLMIANEFVRHYMEEADYETQYFQPVFEKLAKTTKLRGFVTNNWYAAQTKILTYNALSLDDPSKREYYLSFFLERDTINGNFGQLALPTTMEMHFTEDGHWKENAGYHDMPVGDLLQAAVPVENNGYTVFQDHPSLYQASYAMLRYSFPNLQIMGYGDIGRWKHQSPRNLELAIRFASQYAPEMLPGLTGGLNQLISAGLYDRAEAGWYGLLTYLDDLPEQDYDKFEWDRAFGLHFARLYGQRNGTDHETGLMYYVQGATYNHNHANGMAMELYGRGYILGADPGIATTYEDSVFVHYLATFAAHNTVIAAGASEPSVPFTGSGGAKHMGEINLSVMEPAAGNDGVSPFASFTETNYTEPSTDTRQQRLMGIVRTSPRTGYYVDIYRSDNEVSNDYLYHNIGHGVTLHDHSRNSLTLQPDSIPYQPNRQSGMSWIENIMTPTSPVENPVAIFRVEEEGNDDVYMQMLMPLQQNDKVFTAIGPRSSTAPSRLKDLPTPKTIIHRPEAAWDEPFAVVYEPYRGEEEYSVNSVRRIPTHSSFTALEVENRNGTRQLIMQSDTPQTDNKAEQINFTGHYGVISVTGSNKPDYIYLGYGKSVGWNGYKVSSQNQEISASVEFQNDDLIISSSGDVSVRFPYRIAKVTDDAGNPMNIMTDSGKNESVVTFPRGMGEKYHFSAME